MLTLRYPFSLMLFVGLALPLPAEPDYDALRLERVATGLSRPLYVTHVPGDERHLFIVEQRIGGTGRIQILDLETGELRDDPFLEISGVTQGGEEGLLGLAFHPEYATNGEFFVYYTLFDASVNPDSPHAVSRLSRFTVPEPETLEVDADSEQTVLSFPQPFSNHNGGWIGFGPDGYLYISSGDGGSGNDPLNAAQALSNNPATTNADEGLLGKMLRIDVDGDDFPDHPARNYAIPASNPFAGGGGAPEIWAYGLRNAWRNSFDRETGNLWMADVGQSAREEINFQPASSVGGENYGWRPREGLISTPGVSDPDPTPRVDPILDYDHTNGRSITGGYVYRGEAMPWLNGTYFYGDFITSFVRSLRYDGATISDQQDWTSMLRESLPSNQSLNQIASFGEDARGELYIVSLAGHVFRLTQSPYNLWRHRHFSGEAAQDAAISGPMADPDGDGVVNALEFVTGGDPLMAGRTPVPEMTVVMIDGTPYLEVAWQLEPSAAGYSLSAESSMQLEGFDAEDFEVVDASESEFRIRSTRSIGGVGSPQFFRLEVEVE